MPTLLEKEETAAGTASIEWLLRGLKQAIWRRRPILGEIMQKHGQKNLHAYTKDFLDVNHTPVLDERKEELIATVERLLEARLGNEVARKAGKQLRKLPLVSTADHHGPIDHPFFVNSNIVSSIPLYDYPDADIHYLISFSFASVSVNNASAFPRGIVFHGGMNGSGNYMRLPILPDKLKMGVVHGTRAFTREDVTKAESELGKKERSGEIVAGRGEKIRMLLEEYFGNADVLQSSELSSQITRINYRMWPSLFHGSSQSLLHSATMPDLLYLEIETIVTELLLRRHLHDVSSPLYKLMFDTRYRELALAHFNNIAGGFSLEKEWGTYLFWAVDEKLHRIRLILENGALVSHDRDYQFTLTPESIEAALRDRKIFPSMLLSYLMVSLYYGMKCLGGFCQVHDLTMTKLAWESLLREVGNTAEADAILPVQTKELNDGLVLAYLRTVHGEMVPATGIDMILEDRDTTYRKYVERSKSVSVSEMMNPLLPEMYTVLYTAEERDPQLAGVTAERILRETGLQQKLMEMTDR